MQVSRNLSASVTAAVCYRLHDVHDDVIKWKHFPRYWPFVQGYSPVTGEFPRSELTRSEFFPCTPAKSSFFLLIDNPVIALSKKQADILFPAQ